MNGDEGEVIDDVLIDKEKEPQKVMTSRFMYELLLRALMQGEWTRAFERDLHASSSTTSNALFDIGRPGFSRFPLPMMSPVAPAAAAPAIPRPDSRALIAGTLYARATTLGDRYLAGADADDLSSLVAQSGETYMASQATHLDRHARFLQWQQISGRPWVALAYFVDFIRWAWDDHGGELAAPAAESYQQQVGNQLLLVRQLEQRVRQRAALERNPRVSWRLRARTSCPRPTT